MEFASGILGGEAPMDGGLVGVASGFITFHRWIVGRKLCIVINQLGLITGRIHRSIAQSVLRHQPTPMDNRQAYPDLPHTPQGRAQMPVPRQGVSVFQISSPLTGEERQARRHGCGWTNFHLGAARKDRGSQCWSPTNRYRIDRHRSWWCPGTCHRL